MERYQPSNKNYYEILLVSTNAESEVITAAYRRLAKKYHPDVTNGNIVSSRMADINEAYEVLHNPGKRAEYNKIIQNTYTTNKQPSTEPRSRRRHETSNKYKRKYSQRTDYSYQNRNESKNTWDQDSSKQKEYSETLYKEEARREAIIQTRNGLIKICGGVAIIAISWFATRSIGALMALGWIGLFLIITGIVDIFKAIHN